MNRNMFNFTKLGYKVAFALLSIFESNDYRVFSPLTTLNPIINLLVSSVILDTYREKVENSANSL